MNTRPHDRVMKSHKRCSVFIMMLDCHMLRKRPKMPHHEVFLTRRHNRIRNVPPYYHNKKQNVWDALFLLEYAMSIVYLSLRYIEKAMHRNDYPPVYTCNLIKR